MDLPRPPADEAELDAILSYPTPDVVAALERCPGDVIVLGAGGKMGPTLARMVRRALDRTGRGDRVIAVSRFGAGDAEVRLHDGGVETIRCDLTDRDAVAALPDAPNVIFMAGQKFGTRDAPSLTWMMNVVVPAIAAERYAGARIVAFSTGNVYPLTPVERGGAAEDHSLGPIGEYAQSCVGRERVLEYASALRHTPVTIVRLNYACDLRYGVVTDVALRVWRGQPIDLEMGHANVIWQGDANARVIQCLPLASSPPFVLNVTGSETLSIRAIARRLGELMGREPEFFGSEAPDALLSDARRSVDLFGPPGVAPERLLEWAADWVSHDRRLLGKPTHFDERAGAF